MSGSKRRLLIAGIVLFVIIGVLAGNLLFNASAKRNAAERAGNRLVLSADERSATLAGVIYGQFQTLDLISTLANAMDSFSKDGIKDMSGNPMSDTDMSRIGLFNSEGRSVSGKDFVISGTNFFKRAMSGEDAIECIRFTSDNSLRIVLAVPWYKAGAIVGVVAGVYSEDDLRKLFSSSVYYDEERLYIIDPDGGIVSANDVSAEQSGDIFKLLKDLSADKDGISAIDEALKARKSVSVEFANGEAALAVLKPLSIGTLPENNLSILIMLSREKLLSEVIGSRNIAVGTMAVFAIFTAIALLLFLILDTDKKNRLQRESEQLRQREEQFRIVAKQSGKSVYRYDIKTGSLYCQEASQLKFIENAVTPDMVENALKSGYVAEECAREFKDFFEKIASGLSYVSGVFLMQDCDGEFHWYKHDATTLFDAEGNPQSAIISYFDYSNQRELEVVYARWQQEINRLANENVAIYEWNMTRDVCDSERGSLIENYKSLAKDTFNARTELYTKLHVLSEDAGSYRALMNREGLIECYNNGIYTRAMEYRYFAQGGGMYWRRISVQLVQYPGSQDIKAFIINESVDTARRAELDIIESAKIDVLTGALNRAIFTKRVEDLLSRDSAGLHAFFMLDIDRFKQVNDTYGHDVGDQTLSELIGHARQALRCNDIIGRIGGDEFMIVISDIPDEARAKQIADRLCAGMRIKLSDELMVSVSIGVAMYPRDGRSFDELYKNADSALYNVKQNDKGGHCFYASLTQDGYEPTSRETAQGAGKSAPVLLDKMKVFFIGGTETEYAVISRSLGGKFAVEHIKNCGLAKSHIHLARKESLIVIVDMGLTGDDVKQVLGITSQYDDDGLITTIALIPENEPELATDAVEYQFDGYIFRPIGDAQLAPLLRAIITKSKNEQLRYRESILALKQNNDERYWRLLSAAGVAVVTIDLSKMRFDYSSQIKSMLSGTYDERTLWDIFKDDDVAYADDIRKMRDMVSAVSNNKTMESVVTLRVTSGQWHKFRFIVNKSMDKSGKSVTMTLAFSDVNEEMRMMKQLEMKAQRDLLTGLYNREFFLERVSQMVSSHKPGYYVLSCFDIDNFKTINDKYGTKKGDDLLIAVAKIFKNEFDEIRAVACRVSADNFAALYPKDMLFSDMPERIHSCVRAVDKSITGLTFSIGRYIVDDLSLPVSAMYDRARIARSSVKGRYDVHVAQYDESMRESILRDQAIISEMDTALEKGQFEMWLQPQFNYETSALIGAEALVRWRHPQKGVLAPSSFISVFERTGFIYEMDKYMWKRACEYIKKWMDEGYDPLPISVNVSRYDIFREDFFKYITSVVEYYETPVNLLRLEITESAFANDTDQIIEVVKMLNAYGFIIEIDDFGSGYSSFNTLKEVPANILKLDMRLLDGKGNSRRGGNILESIVRMSRWLGMPVIAEGVETREHADFLKSIGCAYIQGYLFSQPVTAEEYESLCRMHKPEHKLNALETLKGLDSNVFWDPKSMETLIFNSYVGGACIFEYHNGLCETLRVNDKYAQILGGGSLSFEQALNIRLNDYMNSDDANAMNEALIRAIKTGDEENCVALLSSLHGKREKVYIRISLKLLATSANRYLLYCTIDDLTAQWNAEKKEKESFIVRQAIMDKVGGWISAMTIKDSNPHLLFANDIFYERLGYTKEQAQREGLTLMDMVYPDDVQTVWQMHKESYLTREPRDFTFRALCSNGNVLWMQSSVSVTNLPGIDEPVLLNITMDITVQKNAEQAILEKTEQLYFLNDTARDLLSELDTNDAINSVLTKIIRYFNADRAYIFEFSESEREANNTYEICAEGVRPEKDNLQHIPFEKFGTWFETFNNSNHIEIPNVDELDDDRIQEKYILESQGINSLAAVALRRSGKLIGFAGVDDPRKNFSHVRSLEALGDYMAVILTRRDLR